MAPTPRILVVDDEPSIRATLNEFLSALDYCVVEARDGAAALATLETTQVDIVLTDLHMPAVSGLELLKGVKQLFPYLPVVLITGESSVDAAVQCLRHGADDYLTKPFDLPRLLDAVESALAKRANAEGAALPDEHGLPLGYSYIRTLGEGSMGVVHLAREEEPPQRLVALKILRLDHLMYEERREVNARFQQEIRAARMVDHPNVVSVLAYGTSSDTGRAYVAMEYVQGQPLTWFISRANLSLSQKLDILAQITAALSAIHALGICHRDIKPANVLLDESMHAKLTDFGVARLPDSELTQTRQLLGSPSYMAPEAFLEAGSDPRSDIFSCGVVAYELLHSKRLFTGDNLAEIMHHICRPDILESVDFSQLLPSPLTTIIRRCLAYDPADRFPSATALHQALEELR